MADCNVSIDQKNLPGVKEVCRDFAVLEDHSLAYNLQEQEIESHLASNVHKSRLVQQDLQVAKRLQEEEDLRAKAQSRRLQTDIERQDTEIAHEIQEELVRQAEQQRQQEEKDAAIARKLHEKEMKEERKRQKQLETNFDDEYVEDQGVRRPLDLDKPIMQRSLSPIAPLSPHRDYSPEYSSTEPKRSRYPKRDPAAPHSRSRYPEHSLEAESSRGRHADPYPEHLLSPRGKHGERYPDYGSPTETGRRHTVDSERVVRRKERPARPPPPHTSRERDKSWEQDRYDRYDEYDRHHSRGRQEVPSYSRDGERSRDRGFSADRLQDKERHRHKDPHRARTRSRDRVLDEDYYDTSPGPSWDWPRRDRPSWEEEEEEQNRRGRGRRRVESNPDDVFMEHNERGRKETRELWEGPIRERGQPNAETGRVLHKGSGEVVAETDYKLTEATKGLTKLGIHEQELKDREVARKLQEEELKTNSTISRAAQVAQDEEIARLLMEQEKKEYKKQREREKERQREKERERDRNAAERKRHEAEYRPNSEEVVRPRTRDEYEYQRQKNHNKPARPPQPRPHEYANVNPAYSYPDQPLPPRGPSRPEPTSRGAYYKR
ncbi:coiled-coil domain-containing protein 50 isoform X1 [Boleophthalmus pectinirostris]|uniref:coiled-coil domain-containing protein 50 isoform X1 n=1 Tax=Boleophthalmus pectinirostris TaxID=150288 RepID=UPI00242FC8BA|nr:coiled-coil domain-containing protein 50 isoform X1 [Boleophthalmus pectinirostris]